MIHTRNISEADFLAVKALWSELHAQAISDNCWPGVPNNATLAHIVAANTWTVVEEDGLFAGFTFWKLDPDGNAFVRAIAAVTEVPYLHLVVAGVSASETEAYGMLARNRPERSWFENIGATFEPCGYEPLTPTKEAKCITREEKLATRVPTIDKVIVPVALIPTIQARLETL